MVNHYRPWPLLANMFHNPFHGGDDLPATRALAGPQYRGDQFASKTFINMQWLITGLLIITAEQSQLLMTVHNILCIVKIQDNDLREVRYTKRENDRQNPLQSDRDHDG